MVNLKHIAAAAALAILLAAAFQVIAFGSSPTLLADSPPRPDLSVDVPDEVPLDEPFEIRLQMRNRGGEGDQGGISATFLDIRRGIAWVDGFSSEIADIEVDDFSGDASDVTVHKPGSKIWNAHGEFQSRQLLIEADSSPWQPGDTETLTLTVHPKETGKLDLRVRSWICEHRYQRCARDPSRGGSDQQGYASKKISIDVVSPRLTSCYAEPNPASAGRTVHLKAGVEVPDAVAKTRLHVEFKLNGQWYESDSHRVARGARRTFSFSADAPPPGEHDLRCRLYADGESVDSDDGELEVKPHEPPRIVAMRSVSDGVGSSGSVVRAHPGEVRFEVEAVDPNADLKNVRWIANHTLTSYKATPFVESSDEHEAAESFAFPLEGVYVVEAVFTDARDHSVRASWSVTIDDGRDDLSSAISQIANANLAYSNLVCESEPVCRDRSGIRNELAAAVDKYETRFAEEVDEAKLAETERFLTENGYADEAGDDVRSAARYLNLGAICGEICYSLQVEGWDSLWYSVGWQALGFTPGADIGADTRDALWLGGQCIDAAIHAIFGSRDKKKHCDAVGLAIGGISIIPVYGKGADGLQIVRHAQRLVKDGRPKVAVKVIRLILKGVDKLGSVGKPIGDRLRDFIVNNENLFAEFRRVSYPDFVLRDYPNMRLMLPAGVDKMEKVPGFKTLKGQLDSPRGQLGAARVLETLAEERFHGWTIGEFGREYRLTENGVERVIAEVDAVLFPPKSDDQVWLESHGLFARFPDDPGSKAERLLDATRRIERPDERPDEIIYRLYYDLRDDPNDTVGQTMRTVEREIAGLHGDRVRYDFDYKPHPATGTSDATGAPATGGVQIIFCNQTETAVEPEFAIGLWGDSPVWQPRGFKIPPSGSTGCNKFARDVDEGDYYVRVRALGVELTPQWIVINLASKNPDNIRPERTFYIREEEPPEPPPPPEPETTTPPETGNGGAGGNGDNGNAADCVTERAVKPSLSPDGRRVAFVCADSEGDDEIFTARVADRSDIEQLTRNSARDTVPLWTTAGIIFFSDREGGALYIMEADGSNQRRWGATPTASPPPIAE